MRKITALILITLLYQPLAFANVSLTASDGTGLEMKSFKAKVVVEGLFAFTEIEMVFHNPQKRQREGRFQIVLPQGAAISRFAMSRGNQLLEGEVVERKLAQRAYEDFLHRRQDPALLEVDQGNRFNARVFPIVAKENKRIIVSYSQTLTSGQYLLPLKGLPQVDEFSLRIMHDTNYSSNNKTRSKHISGLQTQFSTMQLIKVDRSKHKPARDFVLPLTQTQAALSVRSGTLMATRVIAFPNSNRTKHTKPDHWTILVDTSASQAPYLKQNLKKLKQLRAKLKPKSWNVFSFDQGFRKHKRLKQIKSSSALGASNLEYAIKQLNKHRFKSGRLLIISDVVATAGETTAKKLGRLLRSVKGIKRVDVLIPSSHHEFPVADSLRQSGKQAGVVTELQQDTGTLTRKLMAPNYTKVPVDVAGSKWYWPKTINAIQAGEAVTVFAELDPTQVIQIRIADQTFSPEVQKTEALLLKREWARARVGRLSALMQEANDPDISAAMLQQIINVSVKERIITPYTALLVLESSADYQRYGIKQQAMADILTIGMEGITVANRSQLPRINLAQPGKMEHDVGNNTVDSSLMQDEAMTENKSRLRSPARKRAAPGQGRPSLNRPSPQPSTETAAASSERLMEHAQAEPVESRQTTATRAGEFNAGASSDTIRREAPPVARARVGGNGDKQKQLSPWTGQYKKFRDLLSKHKHKRAYKLVTKWRRSQPQDVMALVALGEYYETMKDYKQASRAYGSLIDYFPARADIRRWAAGRLLKFEIGHALALDSLIKAVAQRPDHPSGHYLLAWAYWLNDKSKKAKTVLRKAIKQNFPRFAASQRILKESLDLISGNVQQEQLRFVLTWETDANDVDFHVRDGENNHAYYSKPSLPTGGRLYHDITTGYGPENFTINNPGHYPYKLSAHYYSMGPMGYGMGVLNIVRYNHKTGKIKLEFRPFVVMTNRAFVDLGKVKRY